MTDIDKALKAYDEATALANKAYVEATAPARKAYHEAIALAKKAYLNGQRRTTRPPQDLPLTPTD